MEINIRIADKNDLLIILRLLQAELDFHNRFADDYPLRITGFSKKIRRLVGRILTSPQKNKIWLAVSREKPIGFLFAKIENPPLYLPSGTKGVGVIAELFLQEEFRKKRIGKRLLSEALEWFRQSEIERIEVEVDFRNRAALVWYEKVGFVPYRTKLKLLPGRTL